MAISIGAAVGEGFTIMGRRPLAVLGWAVAYLVFTIGILVLLGGALFGAMASFLPMAGGTPNPSAVMAALPALFGVLALLLPLGLIFQSIVTGAIFRAVLEPENTGFAYLRLGAQELWLALVYFVQALLVLGLYIVAALIIGLVAAVTGKGAASALLVVVAVLACLVGLIYLLLRLSLAGPATFSERRFALFDSWGLTRGNAAALLGVAVVLVLICIGIWIGQLILNMITNLAAIGAGGGLMGSDPAAMKAMFSNPAAMFARLGPLFILQLVLSSIFSAIYLTVINAPFANAYRQLRGPDAAATFS